MGDIQVQDPYMTRPKFYKYESEDRQVLIDLLHEYSDKLVFISGELETKNHQTGCRAKVLDLIDTLFKFSFCVTGISLTITCFVILRQLFVSKYQFFLLGTFESSDIVVVFFLLTVVMVISLFLLQVSKPNARNLPKKIVRSIYLLDRDARMIADKLEKVMRVTIEIQDKIEINLARKLELDLRIADAQSALEYYYSIVEAK